MPSARDRTIPRDAASRLRVVTWNVGEVYWPWQGNQLKDHDVELVIDALREIDADVVLLQELLHPGQLARLRDSRDGDRYEGAMPARCGYDRQVGMLVRSSLRPLFFEHVLHPTSRAIIEAQLTLDGVAARAFSLHFDVFRPARRLEQMKTAAKMIGDPAALTVAGGDFNYDPAVSARLGRVLDLQAEATMHRLRDVAPESGPTLVGLLRVDRMLAGGHALRSATARVAPYRLPLGDHAPVLCDLQIQAVDVDGKAP